MSKFAAVFKAKQNLQQELPAEGYGPPNLDQDDGPSPVPGPPQPETPLFEGVKTREAVELPRIDPRVDTSGNQPTRTEAVKHLPAPIIAAAATGQARDVETTQKPKTQAKGPSTLKKQKSRLERASEGPEGNSKNDTLATLSPNRDQSLDSATCNDSLSLPLSPTTTTAEKANQAASVRPDSSVGVTSYIAPKIPPAETSDSSFESALSATDTGPGNEVKMRRPGRPNAKRSDPNFVQTTAYIRKQTHRDVKVALLQRQGGPEQDFSELIEDLLCAWLETKGRVSSF